MATRTGLARVLRLAGIALAAGVLAAGSILLPTAPLQASTSIALDSGVALGGAGSSPAADAGIIAYADRAAGDIHVIAPDGTGDRVLWTEPRASVQWLEIDLAWRPDGRELAFTSEHEMACSWFDSDIYTIRANGTGYRRITNSPACAVLASLPQGAVTVNVNNYTSTPIWVYVAGAPAVKWVNYSGTVTFERVADFGPGVLQPAIGVYGMYRFVVYPPYADVQPGATVPGGNLTIMSLSGFTGFGAGKVSWKADGSALAYVLRSNSNIWQISANPTYGATGAALPLAENTSASLVAWGPTTLTQDTYLYYNGPDLLNEGYSGIYLNTLGSASGGERLVPFGDYDATRVYDIEWLPDGSGFLFSKFSVGLGYFSNIFRYDLATRAITQLTDLPADVNLVQGLSISPDGDRVVFERVVDEVDSNSSLWLMNINGSNLHKLRDNAGRPAWGRTPAPLTVHTYLPVQMR